MKNHAGGEPSRFTGVPPTAFFIPFEATSAESLEAALAERDAYWQDLLRHNVVRSRLEKVETYGTPDLPGPSGTFTSPNGRDA